MDKTVDIRPSPIAGQWYPGNATRLAANVDSYIDAARLPAIEGEMIAVIAPHAGHIYSGPVAGYAFAALRGLKPDLVVVVSPMHYAYPAALLTSAHHAYETPLGAILIDNTTLDKLDIGLKEELGFGLTRVRSDPEHSLEIELPFLQRILKEGFRLLPVMVRDVDPRLTRGLGLALAKTLQGQNAILVASTDLSHFYPQKIAETLDIEMLHRIEAFDPESVLQAEEEGKGFACGLGAVVAVLWAAKELGADRVQVLHHATSGDITGDYTRVVGYGAAVVTRSRK